MATNVSERHDSRTWEDGKYGELIYTVQGTAEESQAISLLESMAPETKHSLYRGNIRVEPEFIDSNNTRNCLWKGIVPYYSPSSPSYAPEGYIPETGDWNYSFNTGGGTRHITQSLWTRKRFTTTAGDQGPDYKGAIGVTSSGVAGCDVRSSAFAFSLVTHPDDDQIDMEYLKLLSDLTGTVNENEYQGWDPGELLLVGARGQKRRRGDWEIEYEFAVSRNLEDFYVGDIHVDWKYGWEYMWIVYDYGDDEVNHILLQKPVQVILEGVYFFRDFSQLKI